jgi:hypothetical protein
VLLTVVVPLLLPLLFWQLGTGLCVLLAVEVSLLLPLLFWQPGIGLCVLLVITVPLLLPGYVGLVVQIVPLTVNDRQHVLGGAMLIIPIKLR